MIATAALVTAGYFLSRAAGLSKGASAGIAAATPFAAYAMFKVGQKIENMFDKIARMKRVVRDEPQLRPEIPKKIRQAVVVGLITIISLIVAGYFVAKSTGLSKGASIGIAAATPIGAYASYKVGKGVQKVFSNAEDAMYEAFPRHTYRVGPYNPFTDASA